MLVPPDGSDWVGLDDGPLPVELATRWAARPDCGAVVSFSGLVRDHSEGRPGVSHLEYEAYAEEALPRIAALVEEARRRWPVLGNVACLHRVGGLDVGEPAVVVAVGAPHRQEAFEAARWVIDTLKRTVPIWKRETWEDGEAWGADSEEITEVGR